MYVPKWFTQMVIVDGVIYYAGNTNNRSYQELNSMTIGDADVYFVGVDY